MSSNTSFVIVRDDPINDRGVVNNATLTLLIDRADAASGDDPTKLGFFVASDRKLILYHSYSDGWITSFRTVRFYEDWAKPAGGYDALKKNARLFMVRACTNCSRGPGPNVFDPLGALEQWVEHCCAPEIIIATKYTDNDRLQPVERSMPLCTFPIQARYSDNGNINRAVIGRAPRTRTYY